MYEIHVCFSTDNNYAPYCGVAILSMFQNKNPADRIHVYILHKDLTAENVEKLRSLVIPGECLIETVQVDKKQFEDLPLLPEIHLTIEAYYRFVIPRLFPNVDKMLYLDSDIVVKGSLWELYNMDMQDFPLMMARDIGTGGYNTGVTLMNCRQWRKDKIEPTLYEYANQHREQIRFADQDIMNGLLSSRILEINKKWNRQVALHCIKDEMTIKEIAGDENVNIIHYFGSSKPWEGFFENVLVDEYFAYMKNVPWELPDQRAERSVLSWNKYHTHLRSLRSCFSQREIKNNEKIIVLYETAVHKEVECAVRDLGMQDVKTYLIKSDGWKQEEWDFLIVEYHNIAIIDYILQRQGYDLEKEFGEGGCILVQETQQKIDDELLVKECIEYIQQVEKR